MKVYELMVIIDGSLDEEKTKAAVDQVEKTVKAKKGTVTALDEWGKRKLAYPINKQDFGYYLVWRFTAEASEAPAGIENALKIQDAVLRSMVTIANTKKRTTEATEKGTKNEKSEVEA
jgi:small subunit ribosomal protein S6